MLHCFSLGNFKKDFICIKTMHRLFISLFMDIFISFIDYFILKKQGSSAKRIAVEYLMVKLGCLINIVKINCPRTEACGAPYFINL